MRHHFLRLPALVLCLAFGLSAARADQDWPESIEAAMRRAETNRAEWQRAWRDVAPAQRESLQFLLEHMPQRDARTLTAGFLLTNVALAHAAFEKAPWRDRIPLDVFRNEILPYACVNERRDDWRRTLYEKCLPLLTNCATPSEAAHRLNQKLFKLTNVRYSRERRRANQGPLETLETGLATCTGLSILLVDACRAVGVPARIAATPMWSSKRGNHTWVEVWDGDWHFTGAAEPDPKGLDRGWFRHDATQARRDVPEHAIYASSFRKTGLVFPLVWAPGVDWVSAVNVTDRYALPAQPVPTNKFRLLVKVLDRPAGRRVAAKVTVTDAENSAVKREGTSRGESADVNDVLPFELTQGRTFVIQAELAGETRRQHFTTGTNAQELLTLWMSGVPVVTVPSQACYVAPSVSGPALKTADEVALKRATASYFAAPAREQASWKFSRRFDSLLRDHEPEVRRIAWEAYRAAPLHAELKQDFDTRQVRFEKHVSAYTLKTVGRRPPGGWPLFIAMHGGGGAPKEVNDSQWRHMQIYYRDHPELGGYLYLALRAPNDTWNGFYDGYVYPLVANLIRQGVLFAGVDPNKVFLMGYSHGGYGAFAIGPKMPDRFAAIHASAAAPTDGETTPRTLRNTVFTCMVGEKDTMYGRYDRDQKFAAAVEQLRSHRTDIYPVTVSIVAGNGHTGLPDRDKIVEMYPATRHAAPRELTWLQTDKVIRDFFWLHSPTPAKKQEIQAICRDNRVTVTTGTNFTGATVLLDSRLIDFKKPVVLELNGRTYRKKLQPSLRTLCATMLRRGDAELAFCTEMELRRETGGELKR